MMNRDEYWIAFGREFKIRTGTRTQTVRLQPVCSSPQASGDAFRFRLPAGSLKKSDEASFNAVNDLEELKIWLTNRNGKDESSSVTGSQTTTESRASRRKELFLELQPFLQSKESIQTYSDRFLLFRSLCEETVSRLLSMQSTAVNTPRSGTGMVFPQRRAGSVRVSEQEARFQFCIVAENAGNIAWAVEVPTTRRYQQKAKSEEGLSGRTDVALFEYADQWRRILNIEFKAGRASEADFAKDLEQLVREQIPGAWFHLLTHESHRADAISNMTEGLKAAIRVPIEKQEEIFQVDIDIAICVLREVTRGSGVFVGADLYFTRVKYRRPDSEHLDVDRFDRAIESQLKKPENWERTPF